MFQSWNRKIGWEATARVVLPLEELPPSWKPGGGISFLGYAVTGLSTLSIPARFATGRQHPVPGVVWAGWAGHSALTSQVLCLFRQMYSLPLSRLPPGPKPSASRRYAPEWRPPIWRDHWCKPPCFPWLGLTRHRSSSGRSTDRLRCRHGSTHDRRCAPARRKR